MNTSAHNTSGSGSLRTTAGTTRTTCPVAAGDAPYDSCPLSALEPYQKELEFVIAQVWMTSEERIETVGDAVVIDAHLEEEKGVVWRVGDIRSGACLGCALRCYNGVEITLPARH
jgi:hypothetical protein